MASLEAGGGGEANNNSTQIECATLEAHQFWPKLLPILRAIANAKFVAIDMEMSGIFKESNYGKSDNGRLPLDLQQYYQEIRSAATKYNALQLGITCVEEDRESGVYTAKIFNFNINPLFQNNSFGLKRDIAFCPDSTRFLIKNGFDMNALFFGTTYLSAQEQQIALMLWEGQQARLQALEEPTFSGDANSKYFYDTWQAKINYWIDSGMIKAHNFLNLTALDGGKMSKYQTHLIYTLVKLHFPGYKVRNMGEFMQIEACSGDDADSIGQHKFDRFMNDMVAQKQLTYVFEALTGKSQLRDIIINADWLATDSDGIALKGDRKAIVAGIIAELRGLQDCLSKKKTMIVGHNLFGDLVYLMQTFVGELPKNVNDFKALVRTYFPYVIDTKFMATLGETVGTKTSSLDELWQLYRNRDTKPVLIMDKQYKVYDDGDKVAIQTKSHEAGYDSWITAQVFVKLIGQIHADAAASSTDIATDPISLESGLTAAQIAKLQFNVGQVLSATTSDAAVTHDIQDSVAGPSSLDKGKGRAVDDDSDTAEQEMLNADLEAFQTFLTTHAAEPLAIPGSTGQQHVKDPQIPIGDRTTEETTKDDVRSALLDEVTQDSIKLIRELVNIAGQPYMSGKAPVPAASGFAGQRAAPKATDTQPIAKVAASQTASIDNASENGSEPKKKKRKNHRGNKTKKPKSAQEPQLYDDEGPLPTMTDLHEAANKLIESLEKNCPSYDNAGEGSSKSNDVKPDPAEDTVDAAIARANDLIERWEKNHARGMAIIEEVKAMPPIPPRHEWTDCHLTGNAEIMNRHFDVIPTDDAGLPPLPSLESLQAAAPRWSSRDVNCIMDQPIPSFDPEKYIPATPVHAVCLRDMPTPKVSIMDENIVNDLRHYTSLISHPQGRAVQMLGQAYDDPELSARIHRAAHYSQSMDAHFRAKGKHAPFYLPANTGADDLHADVDMIEHLRRSNFFSEEELKYATGYCKNRLACTKPDGSFINVDGSAFLPRSDAKLICINAALFRSTGSRQTAPGKFQTTTPATASQTPTSSTNVTGFNHDAFLRACRRGAREHEAMMHAKAEGIKKALREAYHTIPDMDDDFWKPFRNKLRIFRIQSVVCDLVDDKL